MKKVIFTMIAMGLLSQLSGDETFESSFKKIQANCGCKSTSSSSSSSSDSSSSSETCPFALFELLTTPGAFIAYNSTSKTYEGILRNLAFSSSPAFWTQEKAGFVAKQDLTIVVAAITESQVFDASVLVKDSESRFFPFPELPGVYFASAVVKAGQKLKFKVNNPINLNSVAFVAVPVPNSLFCISFLPECNTGGGVFTIAPCSADSTKVCATCVGGETPFSERPCTPFCPDCGKCRSQGGVCTVGSCPSGSGVCSTCKIPPDTTIVNTCD